MSVYCSGVCVLLTRPGSWVVPATQAPAVFPPGLAVGLGIGALAEVAKKSLRSENSTGEQGPV